MFAIVAAVRLAFSPHVTEFGAFLRLAGGGSYSSYRALRTVQLG